MTTIIDGREVAATVRSELVASVDTLKEQGVTPGLATVLMSDDGASETYVSMKQRDCEEVGMNGIHVEIDPDAPAKELFETIADLNADSDVHGILVQLRFQITLTNGLLSRRSTQRKTSMDSIQKTSES